MKVSADKYLDKLRGEKGPRGRVTLYLDKDIYKEFKASCEEVASSRVIEQFMSDFIASKKSPMVDTPSILDKLTSEEVATVEIAIEGIVENRNQSKSSKPGTK